MSYSKPYIIWGQLEGENHTPILISKLLREKYPTHRDPNKI